jgi:hypothetical protein
MDDDDDDALSIDIDSPYLVAYPLFISSPNIL